MKANESIRLLSVYHTGTHFMQTLFKDNGIDNVSHRHYGKRFTQVPINELIISPIRDPWESYQTCVSRNHLDDNWWGGWQEFNWRYNNEPKLWIQPIDTPQRSLSLSRLSDRLGARLETDWEKQGSGPHIEVEPVDLSCIYELPLVQEFYEMPEIISKYLRK